MQSIARQIYMARSEFSVSKEMVIDFVRWLCKSAEYGIAGEKPIAMIAIMEYHSRNYTPNTTLLEMLHPLKKRMIHPIFDSLAEGRLKDAKWSWNQLMGPTTRELEKQITEFTAKFSDVNEAFSRLTSSEAAAIAKTLEADLGKVAKRY